MNLTELLLKLERKIIEQQRFIDDLTSELAMLKKHYDKEYVPKKTNRKLTDEEVSTVKSLLIRGVPDSDIVNQFPQLLSGMLTAIKLGLTYNDVDPITNKQGE